MSLKNLSSFGLCAVCMLLQACATDTVTTLYPQEQGNYSTAYATASSRARAALVAREQARGWCEEHHKKLLVLSDGTEVVAGRHKVVSYRSEVTFRCEPSGDTPLV